MVCEEMQFTPWAGRPSAPSAGAREGSRNPCQGIGARPGQVRVDGAAVRRRPLTSRWRASLGAEAGPLPGV